MRIELSNRSARFRRVVDAAVDAYVEWREECRAVWDAYRGWTASSPADEALAFGAYEAALDREDRAAKTYADLLSHVARLIDGEPAHHPARSGTGS